MLQSCTIILVTLLLLQDAGPSSTVEDIYRNAIKAVEAQQPQVAAQHLRDIVENHANSKYARVAVVYLAEQQIVSGDARSAVELLMSWASETVSTAPTNSETIIDGAQSESDTSHAATSAANHVERVRKLLVTALARLTQEELQSVFQQISDESEIGDHNPSLVSANIPVLRELARRAVQDGRTDQALDWLTAMRGHLSEHEQELCEFQLPMAILRQSPTPSTIERLLNAIDQSQALTSSQRVSLSLAVAEAYRIVNDRKSALSVLNRLAADLTGESLSGSTKTATIAVGRVDESTAVPALLPNPELHDWRTAVDLKRAELLMEDGKFRDTITLLQAAIAEHPSFALRNELKFLLVRALIAEIEFERAATELNSILTENQSASEPRARALWLLAEIELMKRETDSAIRYYQQVIALENFPQWHARCLLQLGKCMELSAKPLEAIKLYQQVLDKFADSDVSELARQRLLQLQSQAPQAKSIRLNNPQLKQQSKQGQANQLR